MERSCFVITISHQLGSGGAYLGQKLSERLEVPFFDREILRKVANQLNLTEAALEHREEKLSSFWQSLSRLAVYADPVQVLSPQLYQPSDRDLFEFEAEYIRRISEKSPGIFLGRCGRYILRDHPRHLAVLVHADLPQRIERVRRLYHLSADEAKSLIETNDRERTAYIKAFANQNWLDARWYDLCVNTSSVGLDPAVELALACVAEKIKVLALPEI